MNCNKCGSPIPDDAFFCPACGEPKPTEPPVQPTAPVMPDPHAYSYAPPTPPTAMPTDIFTRTFSSPLFLTVAILFSISAFFTFNILSVLFVIAAWLLFAAAKKGNTFGYHTPLKMFSGISLAEYILNWIAVGTMGLCAVVFGILTGTVGDAILPSYNEILYALENGIEELKRNGVEVDIGDTLREIGDVVESIAGAPVWVLSLVFTIAFAVIAVIYAVINLVCYRKLRLCARSFVEEYEGRGVIAHLGAARGILIFFMILGVGNVIASLGNFRSFLAIGAQFAAFVCLFILLGEIKKEREPAVNPYQI